MADALESASIMYKLACESCKLRKLKCDRGQPSCGRCVKSKVACVYLRRRKPGFPRGQRRDLEEKIGKLEAEVRQRREAENRPLATPSTPAQSFDWSSSASAGALEISQSSLDDAAGGASPPALPPVNQPQVTTFERTHRLVERPPPTDLVMSLVSLFYRHISPWIPFLDPTRVFAEMGAMSEPSVLYLALFNISLTHSLDPRLDQESSDSYWKYAKRRIFVEALEEPSYTALEALTVVTLDLSGMTNGPQVWGSLAVVIKLATQLKAMEGRSLRTWADNKSEALYETINQTQRRRLFWAIYAVDTYLTITTGNPSDLGDCHVQQFLPTRPMTWQCSFGQSAMIQTQDWHSQQRNIEGIPSNGIGLAIFNHQLELLDVSRVIHRVYLRYAVLTDSKDMMDWMQEHVQVSTELDAWRNDRSSVALLKIPCPPVIMLFGYYHALNIHLHGLIACPPDPIMEPDLNRLQASSQSRCADNVRGLVSLIQQATPEMVNKLGWPFAWAVWVAGRYLLAGHKFGIPYEAQQLDVILNCLRSMGKYWQISTKYWSLLDQALIELSEEDIDHSSARANGPVLSLLADLRVPTSDLEDQFRIDPVLHNQAKQREKRPRQHATQPASAWSGLAMLQSDDFPDVLDFEQSEQFSNTWYNLPLYATSAYQQFLAYS